MIELLVAFLGWLASFIVAAIIVGLLWVILTLCGVVLPHEAWIIIAVAVGLTVSTIAVGLVMS
ncbi:hypothetical protein [Leucobacter tenebrionis]|uniref:hypothetical protein n=1 Tax=Leucobacter tenebrionis TaxID=2873270 RepID=UPI001CA7A3FF|nr:hypothetical protein [Leucobacter tenebrionis]QZY52891.1 hypothetical protein KVY00_05510 [Leucobacter tenebrionis]